MESQGDQAMSKHAKYNLSPFVLLIDSVVSVYLGVAAHAFGDPEAALVVLMAISAAKSWFAMKWFLRWSGGCTCV